MSENDKIPAGLDAAVAHTTVPDAVYSTRDALDIMADSRPDPETIWGGLQLVPGQIMEIIGSSGLGKSRIVLNLAINQILGRPFAGFPTLQRPLTWLFYGNENSFFRFRHDLRKMTSTLGTEDVERLRGRLWLPTMENAADAYVSFSDERNRQKLKATMRLRKPDVLVLDPWGSIIDGDELSDGDVRKTLMEIVDILAADQDEKKPTVAIVLNHSRNGLKEMIDAAGAGKGNFGKNSKAIYSTLRCVWNLRPAHLDEPTTKIELLNAKASDRVTYAPVAIDLNPRTLLYHVDTTFNHAVWQAALELAYRRGSSALTAEDKNNARLKREADEREMVLTYVTNVASVPRKILGEWAKGKSLGENRIRSILSELHQEGKIAVVCDKANARIICTPQAAISMVTNSAPDTLRLVSPSPAQTDRAVPPEPDDQ